MTNIVKPTTSIHKNDHYCEPYHLHPQKLKINLLFKNNRIRNHVSDFKTYPSSCRVDVINVWSFGYLFSIWVASQCHYMYAGENIENGKKIKTIRWTRMKNSVFLFCI